jgi:hypothetical protein
MTTASRSGATPTLSPSSSPRAVGLFAAACLVGAMVGGCSQPLLSPKDSRTPFDRYDAVRQQYASQYVEDKFGRRQPNLRARLAPKE